MAENTTVYLVAGEHSGDVHGAALMRALRDGLGTVRFAGLGGPEMAGEGGETMDDWIGEAAVVGLVEVLKKYGWFRQRFAAALEDIVRLGPEVVVLIDYPGFNLRLARGLRRRGYRGKIAYYISPQVWAWNRGRIPVMARLLDLMICIFPFEKALYQDSGLKTVCGGHPLVDGLAQVPRVEREEGLVGLFPGSREREVSKLFPLMLEAAGVLREERPGLRAVAAAANPRLAERMEAMVQACGAEVDVQTGTAHALMQRATVGVVASGTATLEAAWFGLPYCLVYRVAWPTYWAGKALVKVPYLGIVNILAEREVVREFIQGGARPEAVTGWLRAMLDDPQARKDLQGALAVTVAQLGEPGSPQRAADAILELLS